MKEEIKITNEAGHNLYAQLDLPANGEAHSFAIIAHCFTCNSNFTAVRNIARELTNIGFGVLRFDFTGLGKSDGDFEDSRFSSNIKDLIEVHQHMVEHYTAPTLLIGHSLGGAAVLMAAKQLEKVKAIVTIGAPSEASHVKHLFKDKLDEISANGAAEVHLAGRPFNINKQFIQDLENHEVLKSLEGMRKALLILHSPQDAVVNIENAAEIYAGAFHPKSFISLDGADHLLTNKSDSNYVAAVIAAWASRYLASGTALAASEPPGAQKTPMETNGEQVAVHLDLSNNFTTQLSNGKVGIVADEPEDAGGEDLGFSPYELLNGALGACTAMTLKLYAERKKWPLEEVFVYLSHERKHADDMDDSRQSAKIDHLTKHIKFIGDLSEEQKAKLMEISAKCPVHKTLTSDTIIKSNEVNA